MIHTLSLSRSKDPPLFYDAEITAQWRFEGLPPFSSSDGCINHLLLNKKVTPKVFQSRRGERNFKVYTRGLQKYGTRTLFEPSGRRFEGY